MDKAARLKLKQFLEDNIPFKELKQAGVFPKEIRKTDYEKIAAVICRMFGLKSIYEYGKITCSGIICYDDGTAEFFRPNVDMGCPTNWDKLKPVEAINLISKDEYLN